MKLNLGLGRVRKKVIAYQPLISHYPLILNSIDIVGGINGVDTPNLTYPTSVFGNSPLFTGAEYINIGNNHDLGITDKSFSIWIYPTALNNYHAIFGKSAYGGYPNRYSLVINPNKKLELGCQTANTNTTLVSTTTIALDTPIQIFVTFNRADGLMSLFVDGIKDNSMQHYIGTTEDFKSAYEFEIGAYQDNNGLAFTNLSLLGTASTLKIFNKVPIDAEILNIYNTEKTQLGV